MSPPLPRFFYLIPHHHHFHLSHRLGQIIRKLATYNHCPREANLSRPRPRSIAVEIRDITLERRYSSLAKAVVVWRLVERCCMSFSYLQWVSISIYCTVGQKVLYLVNQKRCSTYLIMWCNHRKYLLEDELHGGLQMQILKFMKIHIFTCQKILEKHTEIDKGILHNCVNF